ARQPFRADPASGHGACVGRRSHPPRARCPRIPPECRMTPPVLLVDDHALFAQAVGVGLSAAGIPAQRVVPRSAAEIVETAAAAAPVTVLLDLRLGTDEDGAPIDGLDLVAPITAQGCRVLVVTSETGDATWGTAVEQGAVA